MLADEPPTAEVAEIVRRLLGMIDDEEIEVDTPQTRRMERRLEGEVGDGSVQMFWNR